MGSNARQEAFLLQQAVWLYARFTLSFRDVDLKTAKALGLEIPPTLLARADEAIE